MNTIKTPGGWELEAREWVDHNATRVSLFLPSTPRHAFAEVGNYAIAKDPAVRTVMVRPDLHLYTRELGLFYTDKCLDALWREMCRQKGLTP